MTSNLPTLYFQAATLADTAQLASMLAAHLPPGAVIALHGTLGAGKTQLVQRVAEAAGLDAAEVTSPTFVLLQHYGGGRIHHFDAYRLADEDEFWQLGPEECFDSDGWTFIEWPQRVGDALPQDCLHIRIQISGPTARTFEIASSSPSFAPLLAAIGSPRE